MTALIAAALFLGCILALYAVAQAADRRFNRPPAEKMARNMLRRYRYTPRRSPR